MTMTPEFLVWCVQNEYDFPSRITIQDIKDKSKANRMAKGLVCMQATWFCLQFVTRLGQALPVSLLELNAFAHALCALLVYIFWWNKPFDIEEPILVHTESSDRIRALSAMALSHSAVTSPVQVYLHNLQDLTSLPNRKRSAWRMWNLTIVFVVDVWQLLTTWDASHFLPHPHGPISIKSLPWGFHNNYFESSLFATQKRARSLGADMKDFISYVISSSSIKSREKSLLDRKQPAQMSIPPTFAGVQGSLESFSFVSTLPPIILLNSEDRIPGTKFIVGSQFYLEIDERTLCRLQWGSKVLEDYDSLPEDPANGRGCLILAMPNHFIMGSAGTKQLLEDTPKIGLLDGAPSKPWLGPGAFAMTLSSVLYGGLHGLAFGVPFHSRAEAILWNISCLTVASGGFAVFVLTFTLRFKRNHRLIPRYKRQEFWARLPLGLKFIVSTINRIHMIAVIFIVFAVPLFYVLSRVYLVVEVFLNLPYVDPGVYQTPNWSIYWPHIT